MRWGRIGEIKSRLGGDDVVKSNWTWGGRGGVGEVRPVWDGVALFYKEQVCSLGVLLHTQFSPGFDEGCVCKANKDLFLNWLDFPTGIPTWLHFVLTRGPAWYVKTGFKRDQNWLLCKLQWPGCWSIQSTGIWCSTEDHYWRDYPFCYVTCLVTKICRAGNFEYPPSQNLSYLIPVVLI